MERQASFTLPSPTETPFRTPSSSLSHRSRDFDDMSPSSTPPPLPSDARIVKKRSHDSQSALDESLSPLDPRRFTPTLHASLVSEILSLRRDLENKTKSIDQLEQSLYAAQSKNDGLSKSLLASNKETRSVKRQMQLLEGGTLSAINDLSKERDDAVHEAVDLRRRLDQSQKRAKTHEDSAERIQGFWEKDREAWAAEKRNYETRIHVSEGKLKSVLQEFTQVQMQVQAQAQQASASLPDDHPRSESRQSVPYSPTKFSSPEHQRRRQSVASISSDFISGRISAMSLTHGQSTTLAEELALDDIEERSGDETDHEGHITADEHPMERRSTSSLSFKAKKVLGLPFDLETLENEHSLRAGSGRPHEDLFIPVSERHYIDTAVQYSPPPSPIQPNPSELNVKTENSGKAEGNDPQLSASNSPVMVSTSCQTMEHLPSPPLTPKQSGLTLVNVPNVLEKIQTKDMCTQTDVRPRPGGNRYIHSRTSTHDLGIPAIAIIPPNSRPTTPEGHVVLPPRTKNAGCQVELVALSNYTSTSMQTEEIRIDRRNLFPSLYSSQSTENFSKSKTSAYSRRGSSQNAPPRSNSSSKRSVPVAVPVAPANDTGPLSEGSALIAPRPIRSSSLFTGFDDYVDEVEDELDDDIFDEAEVSNRPTAKFTLRSGKLVSQERDLEDIGERSAASAGEALALDILKRSESNLPPELRQLDSPEPSQNPKRQSVVRRAPSATKSANVRRSAMISNGFVAHQSKHSQSTTESGMTDLVPPPIPIPLRYSSARVGKSYSEGGRNSRNSSQNASPTRQYRHKYKPVLRKARSGPAISPSSHARRHRSKSPPLDSRISIVPEMPVFEMPKQSPSDVQLPLTNDFMDTSYEASIPRPVVATGPRRVPHHVKQPSDPVTLQQTSVVDAIAQTMVGEWMYKYVRRRKSFGKPDKDWDPNKSVEELTSNPTSAGVRHKRWVWLAPYERAVMWSSKQPMNGTALLGKGGRKLTVKSVLDVKDDNPMPKNSLTGPSFNRSILILTPQRALKFTATNQERHFVWLTALSFLSHSPLSIGDLAALPPPPDEFQSPTPPSPPPAPLPVGGSFRRRTLRDSIRIAKAPSRQENGQRSITDSSIMEQYSSTRPSTRDYHDPEDDVALPPTIRRFHTRNRSNTAPRPPANAFTSFSQRDVVQNSSFNQIFDEPGSFERAPYPPPVGRPGTSGGRRGSEASTFGRPLVSSSYSKHAPPNAFTFSDSSHNASMTMRMDAFIENKQAGKGGFRNLRLGGSSRPANKDLTYWGIDESPTSPTDSMTPPANADMRLSDSTGRGSVERDIFRGF